jgi:uncharacterized protein YbgA (DUF1722 family)/uncharacterized protein YbbK (DUF523 family)
MKKLKKYEYEGMKIPVGISSCLLGFKVRYDGGHQEDRYITKVLSKYIEFVPVCPEIEMGLPVPRENLRLTKKDKEIRLIGGKTGKDYTDEMISWATKKIQELKSYNLCGYILKKDSPSCGMERVRVYDANGVPQKNGTGIYAKKLIKEFPLLPVEEEGRLNDPVILENFIERVFVYHRIRIFLMNNPTPSELVSFHTAHKLVIMSHNPQNLKILGQIAAEAGKGEINELLEKYLRIFMETLKIKVTPRKHANVMYHVLGYLRKFISKDDKEELIQVIEEYRKGLLPLIVPITLIRHHLRKCDIEWLKVQIYFNPYPEELMLRNKI